MEEDDFHDEHYKDSAATNNTTLPSEALFDTDGANEVHFVLDDDEDEDEEDVEDWDDGLEFELPPVKKPAASQRAMFLSGITNAPVQPSESLLEFAESALREHMAFRHAPPDESLAPPSSAEDARRLELSCQRLKGLPEWVQSTAKALRSSVSTETCNATCNARVLMEQELHSLLADVSLVEEIVERCEEEPTKDSCVPSLEVVVKWIRGVVHGLDREKERDAHSASGATSEQLDTLFSRCDYVLSELSRVSVARILELLRVLREEQTLLRFREVRGVSHKRNTVVGDFFHALCRQLSLCRIQLHMVEIKAHVNTLDTLLSQLDSLETISEELATLSEWLDSLAFFLPAVDAVNSANGAAANGAALRHFKAQQDIGARHAVLDRVRAAHANRAMHSVFHHAFRLQHAEALHALLVELQSLCLSNKMLLLANLSPLSLQPRKQSSGNNNNNSKPVRQLFRQATRMNRSMRDALHKSSSAAAERETEDLSNSYNVLYETNIGAQFVELMVALESPSVARARLAFSACVYIRALRRDELPWQSGAYTLVRERRELEGFSALRKTYSELAFGVDEADLDLGVGESDSAVADFERSIVDSFSQSLGASEREGDGEDALGATRMLFEGAVDLFPTLQRLDETLHVLAYPRAVLFPHVTAALDLQQPFEDALRRGGQISASNESQIVRLDSYSALLRYELFLLSFAVLSHFVEAVRDALPTVAVELIELGAIVAAHADLPRERHALHEQGFALAVRGHDTRAAILHGSAVWEKVLSEPRGDAAKVAHVAELLGAQFAANAQHELAARTFRDAALRYAALVALESVPRRNRCQKLHQLRMEKLLLRLGTSLLHAGRTQRAVSVFKRCLADTLERPESLRNDERRAVLLSWLARTFCELRDGESARRSLDVLKEVRRQRVHLLVDHLAGLGFEKALGEREREKEKDRDTEREREQRSAPRPRNAALSQRFLLNPTQSALPHCVLAAHDLDLGAPLAKIAYRAGQFAAALHSLTPAIVCAEMLVGGKGGAREGVLELADLYFLRGEIQLSASRASRSPLAACGGAQSVSFPFEIGSNQLFAAVQLLCVDFLSSSFSATPSCVLRKKRVFCRLNNRRERVSGIKAAHRRSHVSSLGGLGDAEGLFNRPREGLLHAYTCRKGVTYRDGADLLWDAMKWFRRAWDLFHAAGDEVSAARAANRIGECHLLPSFVPHAFFSVPLDVALDLSNFSSSSNTAGETPGNIVVANSPLFFNPQARAQALHGEEARREFSDLAFSPSSTNANTNANGTVNGNAVVRRFASLEEVERVSSFAFDLHLEASLPVELMESFMNLAEMSLLQGNYNAALPFWWETKDLFLFFFADGVLVPVARRGSAAFLERLGALLDRVVRFLFKCDAAVRNNHLALLEMHAALRVERSRAQRANAERARRAAHALVGVYRALLRKNRVAVVAVSPAPPPRPARERERETAPRSEREKKRERAPRSERRRGWLSLSLCGCGPRSNALSVALDPRLSAPRPAPPVVAPAAPAPPPRCAQRDAALRPYEARDFLGAEPRALLAERESETETEGEREGDERLVLRKQMDFGWSSLLDWSVTAQDAPYASTSQRERDRESDAWRRHRRVPPWLLAHTLCERDVAQGADGDGAGASDDDDELASRVYSVTSASRRSLLDEERSMLTEERSQAARRPLDPYVDFVWTEREREERDALLYVPRLLYDAAQNERERERNTERESEKARQRLRLSPRERELRSEEELVDRVWRALRRVEERVSLYREGLTGLGALRRETRGALCGAALSMLRLRAHSRQFKASLYSLDALSAALVQHTATQSGPAPSAAHAERARAIRLQERLPQLVYVVYIDHMLMLYNPWSGCEHIQSLGEDEWLRHGATLSLSPRDSAPQGIAVERERELDADERETERERERDTLLAPRETSLLLDLCVEDEDARCGGGAAARQQTLQSMRRGALRDALAFVSAVGGAAAASSAARAAPQDDTPRSLYFPSSGSFPLSVSLSVSASQFSESDALTDTSRGKGKATAAGAAATAGNARELAPQRPVPLTLLCAAPAHALPWEALLPELCVVRAFGLAALAAQVLRAETETERERESLSRTGNALRPSLRPMALPSPRSSRRTHVATLRGILGPAWTQKALFVTASYEAPLGESAERLVRQRRTRTVLQAMDALAQSCSHLLREDLLRPSRDKDDEMSEIVRNSVFPTHTRLPDKSLMPDPTALCSVTIGRATTVDDLWAQIDRHVAALQAQSSHAESFFPLILTGFSDLVELSEALVVAGCMPRRDAVLVFAPQCIQDKLLIELKIALDRWCRVDNSASSSSSPPQYTHTHPRSTGSLDTDESFIALTHSRDRRARKTSILRSRSRGSPNSLSESCDVFPLLRPQPLDHAGPLPRSPHSRSAGKILDASSVGSPSFCGPPRVPHSLKAKDRTWAYHVVMDVVQRMQREHSVPIIVNM